MKKIDIYLKKIAKLHKKVWLVAFILQILASIGIIFACSGVDIPALYVISVLICNSFSAITIGFSAVKIENNLQEQYFLEFVNDKNTNK